MDSASTSDKPDASAPTDDSHPDGTFITVLFTATTAMQKSYPANFAKVDKRALGQKRAQRFACQDGELVCIALVCVSSKCAYMSNGSYMYSNLNYKHQLQYCSYCLT